MTNTKHIVSLDNVLHEMALTSAKPDAKVLGDYLRRYPEYAEEIIDFAPELSGTITLTGGQLSITDHLRIDGPGADRLAVSGNDSSRVFRIGSDVAVTIDDLTITHGQADRGGGIWNAGGSQRASTAEPATLYFQPATLPSTSDAVISSR